MYNNYLNLNARPFVGQRDKKDWNEKEYFYHLCPKYQKFFAPTIQGPVERIIVIGDIYGNLDFAMMTMKRAGLLMIDLDQMLNDGINNDFDLLMVDGKIDDTQSFKVMDFNILKKYMIWTGGQTIVVQLGDQVEDCAGENSNCYVDNLIDGEEVMMFFDHMHLEALKSHGAVYSLIGNIEIDNTKAIYSKRLSGEQQYAEIMSAAFARHDKKDTNSYFPFGNGTEKAKKIACTRHSALVIGSNLFIHTDILPIYIKHMKYDQAMTNKQKLVKLNTAVMEWLLDAVPKSEYKDLTKFISAMGKNIGKHSETELSDKARQYYRNSGDYDMCKMVNKSLVSLSDNQVQMQRIIISNDSQFRQSYNVDHRCSTNNGVNDGLYIIGHDANYDVTPIIEILDDNIINEIY